MSRGLILFSCCISFFCACRTGPTKDQMLHAYENKLGIKPSKLAQIDTANFTTIEWINPSQNFGNASDGDTVTIVYRFRNTGNNPLFISNVYSPCGCTIPAYSEKVLLPGEEDTLPVHFNSLGQESPVYKAMIATSNTRNGTKHRLSFEGVIIRNDKK